MKVLSGQVAATPQEVQQLEAQDFTKCRNPRCDYWLSPEDLQDTHDQGYYFSCPRCKLNYALTEDTPFIGLQSTGTPRGDEGIPAEGIGRDYETFVGLTMKEQGDIGETLIKEHGEVPGYGKVTWWSTTYNDPIDGGVGDWAIEVKTLCIDVKNHYFVPGGVKRKGDMVARANELGFKGILGVLVLLDYRKSVADIYVREMPLDTWIAGNGKKVNGPARWKKDFGQKLVGEWSFKNPFTDPHNPQPVQAPPEEDLPW